MELGVADDGAVAIGHGRGAVGPLTTTALTLLLTLALSAHGAGPLLFHRLPADRAVVGEYAYGAGHGMRPARQVITGAS